MVDPLELFIAAMVFADTVFWVLVAFWMNRIWDILGGLMGRFSAFTGISVEDVSGRPEAQVPARPSFPHRHGAQPDGSRCFVAKGKHVVIRAPNAPVPVAQGVAPADGTGGGVDLNEIARSYGYSPEQVASFVSAYSGSIPRGGKAPTGGASAGTPTLDGVDPLAAKLFGDWQKGSVDMKDLGLFLLRDFQRGRAMKTQEPSSGGVSQPGMSWG